MDDDMFFNDYCIVCDRAIVVPKEPEVVNVVKKKVAAGTIRVSVQLPSGKQPEREYKNQH